MISLTAVVSGMRSNSLYNKPVVCYVDTERNQRDALTYAMQQIALRAGYSLEYPPSNSLIDILRRDRQGAIKEYIEFMRYTSDRHVVFVMDVVTDILGDLTR